MSLSAASGKSVTVEYEDAGTGTAASGADYAALPAGTLTFAAGETSKTVTVSVTGDETDEPNETVVLELSDPVNATISTASATGTITDDDDAATVTLSLSPDSIAEGGRDEVSTVTATLDRVTGRETVVTVSAAAGTNAAASDFRLSSNTELRIAAGATSSTGTVTITAVDNATDQPTRSVTVSGSAASDLEVRDPAAVTLTITDDDPGPTAAIDSPSVTEGDDGDTALLGFTVRLSAASGKTVEVAYGEDTTESTAESGTDYTAVGNGKVTFAPGETEKTIAVSVTGDELDEDDETVSIKLTSAKEATISTSGDSGTGTITDDDDDAFALDRRAERQRKGTAVRHRPDLHRDPGRGQREGRSPSRTRTPGRERHGDFGHRLHGAERRDADVRGGGHEQDGHGVGDRGTRPTSRTRRWWWP